MYTRKKLELSALTNLSLQCALLVLSLGLQTKNGVTFMKAAQKLREEFHQEVVELTKNLVRVDMTNPLSSDMFSLLKQSNSGKIPGFFFCATFRVQV